METTIRRRLFGPAIVDGRVPVMDREAEALALETVAGNPNFVRANSGNGALDLFGRIHGQKLWQAQYESIYSTSYPYEICPRCAPAVGGNRVYTIGAEGHLQVPRYRRRTGDWEH